MLTLKKCDANDVTHSKLMWLIAGHLIHYRRAVGHCLFMLELETRITAKLAIYLLSVGFMSTHAMRNVYTVRAIVAGRDCRLIGCR